MAIQGKTDIDQLLAKSLKEIAVRRPVEKITIKEITDKAGVIRPTFYNHFQDKFELIEWIIRTELLEPVEPLIRNDMIIEAMVLLFTNIEKDKAFYSQLVKMEEHLVWLGKAIGPPFDQPCGFQFPQSTGDTGNAALQICRQPCQRIEHICPALCIHPAVLLGKGHAVQQQNIGQPCRMGKAHLQQKFRIRKIRGQWGLCFDVLFTQASS